MNKLQLVYFFQILCILINSSYIYLWFSKYTDKALMILTILSYIHLDHRVPRQCMLRVLSDIHLAKRKLLKHACVDDIATYSVDVPDGEVQRNHIIVYMYAVDLCKYFILLYFYF